MSFLDVTTPWEQSSQFQSKYLVCSSDRGTSYLQYRVLIMLKLPKTVLLWQCLYSKHYIEFFPSIYLHSIYREKVSCLIFFSVRASDINALHYCRLLSFVYGYCYHINQRYNGVTVSGISIYIHEACCLCRN